MNAAIEFVRHLETPGIDIGAAHRDALVAASRQYNATYSIPASAQASTDALTTYLAHLRHIAPLDAELQQSLAELYHETHHPEAAQALVLSNLRLVVKIAREMRWRRASLMELVQQGNVGLSEAVLRFDPTRQVKFSSYASYWIRAMIYSYLMNMTQVVKVGNTRAGRKLFYNLNKARRELIASGIESPTAEDIADHLCVEAREVERVAQILDGEAASLDAPVAGTESARLGDFLADDRDHAPDVLVETQDVDALVQGVFDRFRASIHDSRETAIWDERLVAEDPMTLQDLGARFGVSRERVRQIETRLKQRFRRMWLREAGHDAADEVLAHAAGA